MSVPYVRMSQIWYEISRKALVEILLPLLSSLFDSNESLTESDQNQESYHWVKVSHSSPGLNMAQNFVNIQEH